MTSNIGVEYINLEKSKYNRDRRNAAVPAAPIRATLPAAASRNVSRRSGAGASVNRAHYASAGARVGGSFTRPEEKNVAGEILGGVAEEVGRAIAAKRRAAAREKSKRPLYKAKYVSAATPFPISMFGYIAVFVAIGMFLVLGNTKISEATLRADSLKSAIASEMARAEQLNSALNTRKDVEYIENYAENVLGMVKSTDVAKHYVSISGEDKVVVNGGTPIAASETPVTAE